MTAERSRPWQGAADANGDADKTSVDPSNDRALPTRPSAPQVDDALAVARVLVSAGIPLVCARPARHADGGWDPAGGTGGCGYWLPRGWQHSEPDRRVVDEWQPGDALAAVMGHGVDAIDVDPRNGGDLSRETLVGRGIMPRVVGVAATPSGGTHEFITSLGVGSRDALLPGLDVKGGRPAGSSRGLVFVAPTVKRSKTTGELVAYRWVSAPDFASVPATDSSGEGLAALISRRDRDSTSRGATGADSADSARVSVPRGSRHVTLLSEAGRLRAQGVAQAEALAVLERLWSTCEQPRDDRLPWPEARALLEDGYRRWPEGRTPAPAAALTGGASGSPDRFLDRKDGLLVASLARAVDELAGPLALGPGDTMWVYRDGVYIDDGGGAVREAAVELLGERYRAAHLTNVLQVLKARHTQVRLPVGYAEPDGSLLNLPNGLLDWNRCELRPHSPLVPSVHRVPVRWDPLVGCPATLRFLEQLFGDDPSVITFVEEIVGAVLYGGVPFHQRAIMLLGGGKNGKGTFLKWLRALVGDRNVSEVKPQALDAERFASAQLYGKLANLAGDVGPSAFKEAERFKEITAGDTITAEHKYGQPFSFLPVATVIGSFNEMPVTADRSDGFFRRWLVLPFPHRFVGKEEYTGGEGERLRAKHALQDVLAPEELSGFLVRAVAGLRRLYERGDFSPPQVVKAATDHFREHGDPVVAFLSEHFIASSGSFLPRSRIRREYEDYCETSGTMRLSSARFYEHLPTAAAAAFGCRLQALKRQGVRGYTGLAQAEGAEGAARAIRLFSPSRTQGKV